MSLVSSSCSPSCPTQLCIPTTIGAIAVTKPYNLLEGWGLEEDPLVFCFGDVIPAGNLNLFREQVSAGPTICFLLVDCSAFVCTHVVTTSCAMLFKYAMCHFAAFLGELTSLYSLFYKPTLWWPCLGESIGRPGEHTLGE